MPWHTSVPHLLKFFSLDLRYQLLKPNKFFLSFHSCPLSNVQISITGTNIFFVTQAQNLKSFGFFPSFFNPRQLGYMSTIHSIYLNFHYWRGIPSFLLPRLPKQSLSWPPFSRHLPLESDYVTTVLITTMIQLRQPSDSLWEVRFLSISHNLYLSYYVMSWMTKIQVILWITSNYTKKKSVSWPQKLLKNVYSYSLNKSWQ